MKVLHIIDELEPGGAERALVDLINLQVDHGIEAALLVLLGRGALDNEVDTRIHITYLNRGFKFSVKSAIKVVSVCRQFDLVHVHMRQNLMYLRYCTLWSSLKSTPVVFHDQFGSIEADRTLTLRMKFALGLARSYIGVSNTIASWAKASGVFPDEMIFTLPNTARRKTIRHLKSENNKCIKMVSVGNFRKIKNHKLSIELMIHLGDQYSLDIYGAKVDSKYYNDLSNYIYSNNLKDRVHLVTGEINIQERLHNYDLALHTSLSETGPIVLVEYAAQSLPFIAYKTGQTAEIMAEYVPEFFLTTFELKYWIEKINLILSNKGHYGNMLEDIYTSNFDEKRYLKKCIDIYNETLR